MKLALFLITLLPMAFSKKTYQFIFPESDKSPNAEFLGTIDHTLIDYTICHWTKTYHPDPGVLLTYRIPTMSRVLAIILWNDARYAFHEYNTRLTMFETKVNTLYWFHVCVTSSTIQKRLSIYLNGVNATISLEAKSSISIPPNGTFILGQEQLGPHGSFGTGWAFKGYIADFFLWDRILRPREIAMVYECNYTGPTVANVVNWNFHKWRLWNGVQMSAVDLPCGQD